MSTRYELNSSGVYLTVSQPEIEGPMFFNRDSGGSFQRPSRKHPARVGKNGQVRLSEDQLRRTGLVPGAEFVVEETPQGLLLRPLDTPLRKVYVEPTSACNLSCRTCVRHSWSEPTGVMALDTYQRLLDGLRTMPAADAVSFWGVGEPLLHPDIVEMVARARSLGLKTEMITNGLLLDREMAEGLVEAGLDTIIISADGTSPETYGDVRSGADLRRVQANVDGLRAIRNNAPRHNPEIGLEFVLMRSNVHELANLRNLAYNMGASFIVVTNVLPYTKELADEHFYWLQASSAYPMGRSKWSPDIFLPRLDARVEVLGPLLGLLEHYGIVGSPVGREEQAASYCRFIGEGKLAVAWDGEVSPCIPLMHSYSCYVMGRPKNMRRHTLGNVGQEGLDQIWRRDEYVRFRARVRDFDFAPCTDCGGCSLAESNEEDCYGNTFPVCGDCLWARGVIQCP